MIIKNGLTTLGLKPRGDVTADTPKWVSVAPKMDMCPTKIFQKKRKDTQIVWNDNEEWAENLCKKEHTDCLE